MNEIDEKDAQKLVLFGMLAVAVVLLATTIGLFFGARWSFAFLALCAIAWFVRARKTIREQSKEDEE